jgi:hypothetical protein
MCESDIKHNDDQGVRSDAKDVKGFVPGYVATNYTKVWEAYKPPPVSEDVLEDCIEVRGSLKRQSGPTSLGDLVTNVNRPFLDAWVPGPNTDDLLTDAGRKHKRLITVGKKDPAWPGDDTSDLTSLEILTNGNVMDATGEVMGHNAHATLIVKIYTNRKDDRSDVGKLLKQIRANKQKTWNREKSRPWWIPHPQEQFYHTDPRTLPDDIPAYMRDQAGGSFSHSNSYPRCASGRREMGRAHGPRFLNLLYSVIAVPFQLASTSCRGC